MHEIGRRVVWWGRGGALLAAQNRREERVSGDLESSRRRRHDQRDPRICSGGCRSQLRQTARNFAFFAAGSTACQSGCRSKVQAQNKETAGAKFTHSLHRTCPAILVNVHDVQEARLLLNGIHCSSNALRGGRRWGDGAGACARSGSNCGRDRETLGGSLWYVAQSKCACTQASGSYEIWC